MSDNSDTKSPGDMNGHVITGLEKEWWEDYTPCEDYLKQVSFVASIGTGFTLTASVALAGSTSFQGRTDNTTIALIASTSQIFAWAGSAYAVALFAAITGVLTTEVKSMVLVLQEKVDKKKKAAFTLVAQLAFVFLAVASWGFTIAGTALTGIGLDILAGGSGTMLQWSLFVWGLPMFVLALASHCYARPIHFINPPTKIRIVSDKHQRKDCTTINQMRNTLDK